MYIYIYFHIYIYIYAYVYLHTHTFRYIHKIHTHTYMHLHTYFFDQIHTDNIRAYSTYKCDHINRSLWLICCTFLLLNFVFVTSQQVARSELMLDNHELLIVIGSRACRQLRLASIFLWNEFSDQNVDHIWFLCAGLLPQPDRSIAASIICRRLGLSTCEALIENSNFDAEDAWSLFCLLMSEKSLSVDGWTWVDYLWRTWSVSKI